MFYLEHIKHTVKCVFIFLYGAFKLWSGGGGVMYVFAAVCMVGPNNELWVGLKEAELTITKQIITEPISEAASKPTRTLASKKTMCSVGSITSIDILVEYIWT